MKIRMVSPIDTWPCCPTCKQPVALMAPEGVNAPPLAMPPTQTALQRYDWLCAMCNTTVRKAS